LEKLVNGSWINIYHDDQMLQVYSDYNLSLSTNYYRLKVSDDQEEKFSDVISIENSNLWSQNISMINPVSENLHINFKGLDSKLIKIRMIDSKNALVRSTESRQIDGANFDLSIDISDLPSAIYFVEIDLNGKKFTKKVLKLN